VSCFGCFFLPLYLFFCWLPSNIGFMWFDSVIETFVTSVHSFSTDHLWFSTVFFPQQPLYGGYCLYRLEFFTESFCHLLTPCASLIKAHFVYGSFGIIDEIITYFLCLAIPVLPSLFELCCWDAYLFMVVQSHVTHFPYLNFYFYLKKKTRKKKSYKLM